MSGLPGWCATTIGWVVFMTELDRRMPAFEIGPGGYALALAAAALLVVPALRRVSATWLLAVAFPLYCAIEIATEGRIDGHGALASALEFGGGAVTIFLASRLGRRLALAEDVLTEFAVGPLREPAEPFSRTQGEMFREVRRARRYERPLSLLAVSGTGPQPASALAALVEQARRDSLARYIATRIGALIEEEAAGSTIVAERGDHFLLLLPEAGPNDAEQVAKRLERAAAERYGVSLRCGIASFPHQEITFDKLLESAESALRAVERSARGPEAPVEHASKLASSAPMGS
jgi:hypothetical protein